MDCLLVVCFLVGDVLVHLTLQRCLAHIATTEVCSACQAQHEDTLHVLWSCTKLELVWSSFSWSPPSANAHALSFQELLHRYMQIKEDYRAKIFLIIAWMLWNRRNALRLNLQVQPLNCISSLAGSYLQEFLDVQDQTPTATGPSLPQQWQPPNENKFKVNFDVAVFKSCNQAGLGVIVQDWRGEAIGALSTSVPTAQTVVELEALACCRAVLFAMELGLQDVVFEGDSLQVIQALNLDSTDHLTYIMATFSRISKLKHCNVVADALAKKAKNCRETRVWTDFMPEDIASLVIFDIH